MKITILSDSPFLPTGYSNQAKLLANYLVRQGHEVHFLANGHTGATIDYSRLQDGTEFKYKIYGQRFPYFQDIMSSHLKKTKSDAFIILLDTFMLHGDPRNPQNGWFLKIDTSPAQTFFWYPSDGGKFPAGCELILKKVECPVAMAQFGQKQLADYHGVRSQYIPHGTEPNKFYKLNKEDRAKVRREFVTYTINNVPIADLEDKFVIGCVARNQGRKFMDRAVKTIAALKDRIPNAVLLLHSDPDDPAQVCDLRQLAREYNVENRIRFTGMNVNTGGFGWDKMNEVYNTFDVFFLTTSGEGFGIPIIEAMSCEVPVLVTDYTTTEELVTKNSAGLGIKLSGVEQVSFFDTHSKLYDYLVMNGTIMGSWDVERGICDVFDAANKLVYLYNNPELRQRMGEYGRKAVLNQYDFENIVGPAWNKLIMEVCNGRFKAVNPTAT